jgi:hypothetical protein
MPQLAYVDPSHTVWLVTADGKQRLQLFAGCGGIEGAKEPVASGLSWSPNGQRLACSKQGGGVLALSLTGAPPVQLFAGVACWESPVWSSDGTHLACRSDRGVAISDGTGAPAIQVAADRAADLRWSPRLSLLAYRSFDHWAVVTAAGQEVWRGPTEGGSAFTWGDSSALAARRVAGAIQVLDASSGQARRIPVPWQQFEFAGFALDDTALLLLPIGNTLGPKLVRISDGAILDLSVPPDADGLVLAKGGGLVAFVSASQTVGNIGFAVLPGGQAVMIPGAAGRTRGYEPNAHAAFAVDAARLCWTDPTGRLNCVPLNPLEAPFEVPEAVGDGQAQVASLSDTFAWVAYSKPGTAGSVQLSTRRLPGGPETLIGPALGERPWAWRPSAR